MPPACWGGGVGVAATPLFAGRSRHRGDEGRSRRGRSHWHEFLTFPQLQLLYSLSALSLNEATEEEEEEGGNASSVLTNGFNFNAAFNDHLCEGWSVCHSLTTGSKKKKKRRKVPQLIRGFAPSLFFILPESRPRTSVEVSMFTGPMNVSV